MSKEMIGERTFDATLKGMAESQAYLEGLCADPKPQIIMDEIVSNIVRCSGAKTFRIGWRKEDDRLVKLVFKDDGRMFDPTTEVAAPDVSAPIDEREVGGLGIFMVRKMSKSIAYSRDDGVNKLTVLL